MVVKTCSLAVAGHSLSYGEGDPLFFLSIAWAYLLALVRSQPLRLCAFHEGEAGLA